MLRNILLLSFLLNTPALACTNCLISDVQMGAGLATFGGMVILGRRRRLEGWAGAGIAAGAFGLGTVLGVMSNLVLHFHYMLAPFLTVGATLTAVAILGHRCPRLGQLPDEPGLTPETASES
ncbi:hypothetical protein JST97_20155 [bacterium]|nr:hypothetical protein [bacterium]